MASSAAVQQASAAGCCESTAALHAVPLVSNDGHLSSLCLSRAVHAVCRGTLLSHG